MVKVITITEDVYNELKSMKGNKSFSELLREILKHRRKKKEKKNVLALISQLEKGLKGEKERLSENIDQVLYHESRG